MTHKTKGIVLRTVKYGETSLVVTIFTELFGVQTYMVNGVRSSKKTSAKGACFQPAAILDLLVYHSEQKTMHRIKEYNWAVLFQHVLSDVIKNCIALYMTELLHKCLKQPEEHVQLFYFTEDALQALDSADKTVTANMPLYFALHLPQFFGFKINDECDSKSNILDLKEGNFVQEHPHHPHFIDGENAMITARIIKTMQPSELVHIKLNHFVRRQLLQRYHDYYNLHISDFGQLKTILVLYEVL
jgi:DNA repair protein RecO (recombination protein O)